MSFENIQLPDFLIADLYKDCLVDLDFIDAKQSALINIKSGDEARNETVLPGKNLQFMGEHKQKVTVLVNDDKSVFLNRSDLDFLTNVLKACQLSMGDIAIINTYKQAVKFSTLTEELEPRVVILFNIQPQEIDLPFSIPDFQPQVYAGITYLKAPALIEINTSSAEARVLKTKLWTNLQQIFKL